MTLERQRRADPAPLSGVLLTFARGLPQQRRQQLLGELEQARREQAEAGGSHGQTVMEAEDTNAAFEQQAAARKAALDSCLPPHRADCAQGLKVLHDDQHPAKLQAWLKDPHARTLIIGGGTGNGKTHAAYALAGQAARYGAATLNRKTSQVETRQLVVRAWPVNQYLRELRPEGSPDPMWAVRHRAIWADLLILDDLGAELDGPATTFARTELADLLDARLERQGRTVFTTNQTAAVVEERLGQRLWSRLHDRSSAVVFRGPDRRSLTTLDW